MLSEDAIARIGDYAAHRKALVAVCVFGSAATGRDRQRSDVDLAIMVQGALSPAERVAMGTELSNLVHRDVDLSYSIRPLRCCGTRSWSMDA
jgi:predicted nucleotidyltransferase